MIKIYSEDLRFVAESNTDIFAIAVRNDNASVNCFLDDEEVRELQTLCEYHLRNKVSNNDTI